MITVCAREMEVVRRWRAQSVTVTVAVTYAASEYDHPGGYGF